MRRFSVMTVMSLVILVGGFFGGVGLMGPEAGEVPTVEIDRVEVASYFDWDEPSKRLAKALKEPADVVTKLMVRVPLVLAFRLNLTNPMAQTVTLEELKFRIWLEKNGVYFDLAYPTTYETMSVPPKTTNQLRVVTVLDSRTAALALLVRSGRDVKKTGVKAQALVKEWWTKAGDFPYKIRITEGVAIFTRGGRSIIVPFNGLYSPSEKKWVALK